MQTDIADFYTFRDGRIAQIRQFMDSFNVVEQVLERDVTALLSASRSKLTSPGCAAGAQ